MEGGSYMYRTTQNIQYNLNTDDFFLFGDFTALDERRAEKAAKEAERRYRQSLGLETESWLDKARKMLH